MVEILYNTFSTGCYRQYLRSEGDLVVEISFRSFQWGIHHLLPSLWRQVMHWWWKSFIINSRKIIAIVETLCMCELGYLKFPS